MSEQLGELMGVSIPKIKNGSKVSVGKLYEELYYVKRKNQRKGKEWS